MSADAPISRFPVPEIGTLPADIFKFAPDGQPLT